MCKTQAGMCCIAVHVLSRCPPAWREWVGESAFTRFVKCFKSETAQEIQHWSSDKLLRLNRL